MKPDVSIIIPCFNMGDYVKETLSSIFEIETSVNYDIIVVNDGSNDNGYTQAILDSYKSYPLISVINQKNNGLSHARNTGIRNSLADYVVVLDADNLLLRPYLNKGLEIIKNDESIALIYGNLIRFGIENQVVTVNRPDLSQLLIRNYIDACVILKKKAWESVMGYDEDMKLGYEDWDFNLRLLFSGWNFKHLDETCFKYRVKETSMLTNAHRHRDEIISYMFNKPELEQAEKLREALLQGASAALELKLIRKRKIIKWALHLESFLKRFFKGLV